MAEEAMDVDLQAGPAQEAAVAAAEERPSPPASHVHWRALFGEREPRRPPPLQPRSQPPPLARMRPRRRRQALARGAQRATQSSSRTALNYLMSRTEAGASNLLAGPLGHSSDETVVLSDSDSGSSSLTEAEEEEREEQELSGALEEAPAPSALGDSGEQLPLKSRQNGLIIWPCETTSYARVTNVSQFSNEAIWKKSLNTNVNTTAL